MTANLSGGKLCRHCGCPHPVDHGSPEECIKALKHAVDIARQTPSGDVRTPPAIPMDRMGAMLEQAATAIARQLGSEGKCILMACVEPHPEASYYVAFRGGMLGTLGLLEAGSRKLRELLLQPAPPDGTTIDKP